MKSENKWIRIYKVLVVISCVIILFVGIMFACDAAYYGPMEFLLYFVPFSLLAVLDLVLGMLIASFFENVQVIRDKLEQMNP